MKSLNKAFWGIFLGISFLACIASCKPSVPGEYLSEKEMENVLYDFHIAEAMANDNSRQDGDAAMITYREAVFKKHGITAADGLLYAPYETAARHLREVGRPAYC